MATTDYGISGISPLGTYGLGAAGTFGSYDSYMPSSLMSGYGMNNSIFTGMNGLGTMGYYYNPLYYTQLQGQAEEYQLQHAGNMHSQMLNNDVRAYNETDKALINKMLANGDILQGVQNLYDKVKEGDQSGVCQEFDTLVNYICNNYKDELKSRANYINVEASAREILEKVYGNYVSSITGQVSDLRSDIKRYGEGSITNGFMQGFRGGHNTRYVDETIHHCFGERIDNKRTKDMQQKVAKGTGHVAQNVMHGAMGFGAGIGTYLAGIGLAKIFPIKAVRDWAKFSGKHLYGAGWIGLGIGLAADLWWQMSGNNASA